MIRLLLALLLFALPAAAQDFNTRPDVTDPSYVSMLFRKLSGTPPDFTALARNSDAYKNAPVQARPSVLEEQIRQLRSVYSLMSLQEPIVVETPVKLSAYSKASGGFFVENFESDTFFTVTDGGDSYALVPQGILDRQWMKAGEDVAQKISAAEAPVMVLWLSPRFADADRPAVIDGKTYWLIAVDIQKMALYPKNGKAALWASDFGDPNKQNLLRLRQ